MKLSGFILKNEETSVNLAEVTKGFLANESLLIRTQYLDKDGKRIVLSRAESVAKLKSDGKSVVEGANLKTQRIWNSIICRFFLFHYWISRIPRIFWSYFNIIIFFNVIIGTYERRKITKWSKK